jgi:hypothetical protein
MLKKPNRSGGIMRGWVFRLSEDANKGAHVRSALIPVNRICLFGVALQNLGQLTLLIGGEE